MAESKKRKVNKPVQHEIDREQSRAFNPTKSRVGRIVIVILAIGMVGALFVAAIVNMISVLG
ncbi:MAG: hypothetical protein JXB08_04660 [Bacilli bacterium]|nr:hypothetical protein [Bacilli bacterium]MBN2877396.1 hypothetical protein [Bacilli bacterium]